MSENEVKTIVSKIPSITDFVNVITGIFANIHKSFESVRTDISTKFSKNGGEIRGDTSIFGNFSVLSPTSEKILSTSAGQNGKIKFEKKIEVGEITSESGTIKIGNSEIPVLGVKEIKNVAQDATTLKVSSATGINFPIKTSEFYSFGKLNETLEIVAHKDDAFVPIKISQQKNSGNTRNVIILDSDGNSTFPGTINGTASKALWADLAEIYKSDRKYPCGTLVQFGGKEEITIATTEVNAVVSSHPGYTLNYGDDGIPIALCGRVPILVEGPVKKFEKIYLSKTTNGVGSTISCGNIPKIGIALDDKPSSEIGLVLCATLFNI